MNHRAAGRSRPKAHAVAAKTPGMIRPGASRSSGPPLGVNDRTEALVDKAVDTFPGNVLASIRVRN
jgi:hypothetical protein